MEFGFSYIGALFLLMLFVPNFFWTKNKPKDYDKYVKNENKVLLIFERVGEILTSTCALIFKSLNFGAISYNLIWLFVAFILMILYELYWIRYFKSPKTMNDFYTSFCKIPLAGATLPVIAFLLLGIYARNIIMIISATILGIGHIGIHINHKKEISRI